MIRLIKINTKKFKVNNKIGIVCTTTENRSGTKRYSVEVVNLQDSSIIEREIGLNDSSKANVVFNDFKKKYAVQVGY